MALITLNKLYTNDFIASLYDNSFYFAQLTIDSSFSLKCNNIKISNIEGNVAALKITSTKIIDTIEGDSLEGQHLSGKKLIVLGDVTVKTFISCPNYCDKLCSISNVLPFSTFIIVPKDINENDPVNLKYIVEDISSQILPENKMFICVSLVIQYLDQYLITYSMNSS